MNDQKGCILALDVGDKRVGVAISDKLQKTCRPLVTLKKPSGEAERKIKELVDEHSPICIVVGIPTNEKGGMTYQGEKIKKFCHRLEKRLDVPIMYFDEYLSSEEAKQRLKIEGKNAIDHRKTGVIDALAASIILERYLSFLQSKSREQD